MYNKLFTKILDSTIWLEDDATRLVWITFLAVMDEDGFVALSAIGNVSARARVSLEAAESAIKALEAPDSSDSTQEHEGRRIERVPYGWMVLNATKYRDLIKRETQKEQTRLRVAKHRAKSNAGVTQANEKLTPSVAVAVSETESKAVRSKAKVAALPLPKWLDAKIWAEWLKIRKAKSNTTGSLNAALAKLQGFRAHGFDPNEIVSTSLANGWQGLFQPDQKRGGKTGVVEHNRASAAEFLARRLPEKATDDK